MKILLLSSRESTVDILPRLKAFLEKEAVPIDVQLQYVPRHLDVPACAAGQKGFDLVFVWVYADKESADLNVVRDKLVDIELGDGPRMVKVVEAFDEESEEPSTDEGLAAYWGRYLLDLLFHPENLAKKA